MSTSLETRLVNLLSRWLAGHVSDADLRREVEEADTSALSAEQAEAVEELRECLRAEPSQGDVERTVRETLEALALD